MSNKHTNAARETRGLAASTKYVLFLLAWYACRECGLAWPGVPCLMADTELAESTIRKALDELRKRGLLEPRSYSTGGRKRATEYVVLPSLPELSTAPCGECARKLKNGPGGGGFSAIPSGGRPGNPPANGPHPSENHDPSARARVRAREDEPRTTPPGETSAAAASPDGDPSGTTPADPATVRQLVAELGERLGAPTQRR